MKIVRFRSNRAMKYGILKGEEIRPLARAPFISFGKPGWPEVTEGRYRLEDVRLLAPCIPSKIVAVGLNYMSHARERNLPVPEHPLIFLKPSTSVIGAEEEIIYPSASRRVDYEGELAVVIGKRAKDVDEAHARDYVLGYTCFNDVSARQEMADDGGQVTRSKGYDTFSPMGPWIETDVSPDDLKIETRLNGDVLQSARTSDLIFPVASLISFISSVMTLLPGDVISTGTPAGTGSPQGPGPMNPGDVVGVIIEDIGTLRNRVVAQK
jgi:2-keto-4-pentenoate hydratase/2-oxohepta-3-ene-1,7-dioic acid hydratase in catechol pathway